MDDLAVFVGERRVLAHGPFADDRVDARHGRAAEVVGPVELDERGQDDRQRQLHGVEGADLPFEPHMVDGGAIGVQRSPHCPEGSAVDVEMGIIDGIDLFRGDLVFPRGGGIYGLHAPDGGQADLAAADAVGGAHGAHAGKEQTWDGSRIFVRLNTEPSVGLYDMDVSSLKNEKTARPVPRDGKRPHRRWHGQSRMVLPGRAPVWTP